MSSTDTAHYADRAYRYEDYMVRRIDRPVEETEEFRDALHSALAAGPYASFMGAELDDRQMEGDAPLKDPMDVYDSAYDEVRRSKSTGTRARGSHSHPDGTRQRNAVNTAKARRAERRSKSHRMAA